MKRSISLIVAIGLVGFAALAAERPPFVPITDKTLLNPAPEDWLKPNATYNSLSVLALP